MNLEHIGRYKDDDFEGEEVNSSRIPSKLHDNNYRLRCQFVEHLLVENHG